MSGLPFGPCHPYRQTSEMARKAAQANEGKSPWRRGPFLHTENAIRQATKFQREKTAQ